MRKLADVVAAQGDIRGFHSDVAADPAHGDPHMRGPESRGVVDAVADHAYRTAVPGRIGDEPQFVLGHDPEGGEKDGIGRVFSALLKSEQKGRVYNLQERKRKLERIWKELKPDVILSFIGKNNIMALSTATREDIKVVVSVRADPNMEYNTFSLKTRVLATFGKAAGIVVQTTGARDWFPAFLQKKCVILPNSLNPSFIRKRYVGIREKKIVMVGRLDANKNQAMVMEAFKEATKDKYSDYKLVIYGDGPDRLKLQNLAISLKIDSKVEFKGMVKHVAEHIEKASIYILASSQEGMPNSLIEAMSLGLACISTNCPCGGPADLIVDGINGLLVPVGDVNAMTEAMEKLLGNEVLAESLGNAAMRIQEKYAPDVVNAKWKEYLDNIMQERI